MNFHRPSTVDEAVSVLSSAGTGAAVLAGGTDLLVQLRAGFCRPAAVVDIKQIPELRSIRIGDEAIYIGAAVSGAELNEHPTLPREWPGVAEAFDLIGSTQIQGRATLGGNLCNASPAADSVPALVAAGARCTIAGPRGRRELPIEEVPEAPGRTALAAGEFVVEIVLPRQSPGAGDAYLRLIPRTEMDIAVVGVGVNLALDTDGVCRAARVGLGAVAPTVLRVDAAADQLLGHALDESVLSRAERAVRDACQPIDDKRGTVEYRTHVAGVLFRRAVKIALTRAEDSR